MPKGDSVRFSTTRKGFLAAGAGAVVSAGAVQVAGRLADQPAFAAERQSRACPGRPLGAVETATLVAWCDLLVPGARENEVGDFVNDQLAKDPEDSLLGLRYFTWPASFDGFYRDGLSALDDASRSAFGRRFVWLPAVQRAELLKRLTEGTVPWDGPPFFLFQLATRSDAVDVVYGTPQGYARIGTPYVPLAVPPSRW